MTNVNANINILVNTAQAAAQLRSLQAQVNALNVSSANVGAAASRQAAYNKALADAAVASGQFTSSIVPMSHSVDAFSKDLDKGRLTLGQYARGVASQMPGMRRVFTREFDMISKVAESRVKRLQTQYVALGNAQKALALTPTSLAPGGASQLAMATQKQMIFNKMISDGSTKLLNWGKNTQWAGRQLMVGFTLPLMSFGAVAAKTFMDLDRQARDFKRVYGDAFTPPEEIEQNLKAVERLGAEYTKYGITLQDTMKVAATAAAAGMRNDQLMSGTEESLRLATIGQIDYNQALETTITLQNAFRISSEDMAGTVDFIGAVANQTVLTVDDMTKAIPRVAPVVVGLGGDVKDLAAMMAALREGGVSAENGANALKSGLASLINPTNRASEALSKMGIDINAIVMANKGDLMGTIQAFADALNTLDSFSRQQALEKVFGKYQYAKLSALFDNISKKGTQAATVLDLAGKSADELGALSSKSLKEVEESTTAKFEGAIERLKITIAPVGEAFLKALTPIIDFVSKIMDTFNNLPDGVKDAITKVVAIIGIVMPVGLMLVGLFANMFANMIKGIQGFRKFFATLKGQGAAFKYMSGEELDAAAAAKSLEGATSKLTSALLIQESAIKTLIGLYERFITSAGTAGQAAKTAATAASQVPTPVAVPVPVPSRRPLFTPGGRPNYKKYAKGVTAVPGSGNKDTVPALLTPGEAVVTKEAAEKYAPIIAAMNNGTIQGFSNGTPRKGQRRTSGLELQEKRAGIVEQLRAGSFEAGGQRIDFADLIPEDIQVHARLGDNDIAEIRRVLQQTVEDAIATGTVEGVEEAKGKVHKVMSEAGRINGKAILGEISNGVRTGGIREALEAEGMVMAGPAPRTLRTGGEVERAHLMPQEELTSDIARVRSRFSSRIQSPALISGLDFGEAINAAAEEEGLGSIFKVGPKTDLTALFEKGLNQGMKQRAGVSPLVAAEKYAATGVDKWSETVARAGVSATPEVASVFSQLDTEIVRIIRGLEDLGINIADVTREADESGPATRSFASILEEARQSLIDAKVDVSDLDRVLDTLGNSVSNLEMDVKTSALFDVDAEGKPIITQQGERLLGKAGYTATSEEDREGNQQWRVRKTGDPSDPGYVIRGRGNERMGMVAETDPDKIIRDSAGRQVVPNYKKGKSAPSLAGLASPITQAEADMLLAALPKAAQDAVKEAGLSLEQLGPRLAQELQTAGVQLEGEAKIAFEKLKMHFGTGAVELDNAFRVALGNGSPSAKSSKQIGFYIQGAVEAAEQAKPKMREIGTGLGEQLQDGVIFSLEDLDEELSAKLQEQFNKAKNGPAHYVPPFTMPRTPGASPFVDSAPAQPTSIRDLGKASYTEARSSMRSFGQGIGLIGALGYETAKQVTPVFKQIGTAFLEVNPWIGKSVKAVKDSVGHAMKQASYSWMGMGLMVKDQTEKLKNKYTAFTTKASSMYETALIKGMYAFDKVKGLPAKAVSAFETAYIKGMYAFDKAKTLPGKFVESAKHFYTQSSYTFMGLRLLAQDKFTKLKGAYETAVLKGMYAFDAMKKLPGKLVGAYETAVLKGMLAFDAMKRMPAKITNLVSTFMSDLPQNLQRLRNAAFYKTQDLVGRGKEVARNVKTKAGDVVDKGRAAVSRGAEAVARQFKPVTDGMRRFRDSLVRTGRTVSRAGQLLADPLGRAVAVTVVTQKGLQKLNTALSPVKNGIDGFVGSIKRGASLVSKAAQLMADPLGRAVVISTFSKRLKGEFDNVVRSVKYGANRVFSAFVVGGVKALDGIGKAIYGIKNGFTDAGQKIAKGATDAFNYVMGKIKGGATRVEEALGMGAVKIINGIEKSLTAIKNYGTSVKNAFSRVDFREALRNARDTIKGGVTPIKDAFVKAGTAIKDAGKFAGQMVAGTRIQHADGSFTREGGLLGMLRGRTVLDENGNPIGRQGGLLGRMRSKQVVDEEGKVVGQRGGIRGFFRDPTKNGMTRMQNMGRVGNNAMMALSGVAMAASFAEGPLGEMAQKIMPVTMGLMAFQQILPLLTNPLGLLALAAAAAAAALVKARMDIDEVARKGAKEGSNIGGKANRMEAISAATGYQFAYQRNQERMFNFTKEEKKGLEKYSAYAESEQGKAFIDDLKKLTSKERYEQIASIISQAIADGMDPKQAKEYGYAIAYYTNDAMLKLQITRDFKAGKFKSGTQALVDNLTARMDALQEAGLYAKNAEGGVTLKTQEVGQSSASRGLASLTGIGERDTTTSMVAEGIGKAGVGALAGAGAGLGLGVLGGAALIGGVSIAGFSIAGATLGSVLPILGTAIGAVAGTIVGGLVAWKQYNDQVDKLNANVTTAAQTWGASIQVLKEAKNAELSLIEARRKGTITEDEYSKQMAQVRKVQDQAGDAFKGVVDAYMMGGVIDAGAMNQALENQLVLSGFSGDLAKAVVGTVNFDEVAKAMFPEIDPATIASDPKFARQKEVVKQVMIETLSGLTPENAQEKIAGVRDQWAQIAQDLLNAAQDGLTTVEANAALAGQVAERSAREALMQEEGAISTKNMSAAEVRKIIQEQKDTARKTGKKDQYGRDIMVVGEGSSQIQYTEGATSLGQYLEQKAPGKFLPSTAPGYDNQVFDESTGYTIQAVFGGEGPGYDFTAGDAQALLNFSRGNKQEAIDTLTQSLLSDPQALAAFQGGQYNEGLSTLFGPEGVAAGTAQITAAVTDYQQSGGINIIGSDIDLLSEKWGKWTEDQINKDAFGQMGLDAQQVNAAMMDLIATNPKVAQTMMDNAESGERFLGVLQILNDDKYKNIDIGVALTYGEQKNKTPSEVKADIDSIYSDAEKAQKKYDAKNKGKKNKQKRSIFAAAIDPNKLVNEFLSASPETLTKLGVNNAKEYVQAFTEATENVLDKTEITPKGNIKVTTDLLVSLGLGDALTPEQAMNNLEKMYGGKTLPGSILPLAVRLSLTAPDALKALFGNNKALIEAVAAGATTYRQEYKTPTGSGFTDVAIQPSLINNPDAQFMAQALIAMDSGGGDNNGDNTSDTSGAGGAKEDPIKKLNLKLAETLLLYTDVTAKAIKLAKSKKDLEKALLKAQYSGSFISELRKMGLTEGFIQEILSNGLEAAQEMKRKLGKQGLLFENMKYSMGFIGQRISDNIGARRTAKTQRTAANRLQTQYGAGATPEVIDAIAGDPELANAFNILFDKAAKGNKNAKRQMDQLVASTRKQIDAVKDWERAQNPIQTQLDDMNAAYDIISQTMDYAIEDQQLIVDGIQKEIDAINESIDLENQKIRAKERDKEMIQRTIDDYERQNEMDQRRIDSIQREDALRQRVADALSYELDIMGQKENDIRKAHEKRIEALDQIAKINDHIINQQKNQINLASALTSGDIAAAAQARQEMQAADAQYAMDQMRQGLQTGMENQIEGLTTEGGLTREEAEKKIQDIKNASYQTSLQIRAIEDAIYERNLLITIEKDKIFKIDGDILKIQDGIYTKESEIQRITNEKLTPATKILNNLQDQKAEFDRIHQRSVDVLENALTMAEMTDDQRKKVNALADAYRNVGNQILRAKQIESTGGSSIGNYPVERAGESAEQLAQRRQEWLDRLAAAQARADAENKKPAASTVDTSTIPTSFEGGAYAVGGVVGDGARDSVLSRLTPGEFVIRKASVEKYGLPMLDKINMGSFAMPRYNVRPVQPKLPNKPRVSNQSINAPTYNAYSVNVNVPNTNASPDAIANRVMVKLAEADRMNIRSVRGN